MGSKDGHAAAALLEVEGLMVKRTLRGLSEEELNAISARNRLSWTGPASGSLTQELQRPARTAPGRRARAKPNAIPAATETDECRSFIAWTRLVRYKGRPLFDRVVKIANERGKAGASIAILTAIGMRKGFPDYEILAPAGGWSGLFLEAKDEDGSTSPEQYNWRDLLVEFGYHAEICVGSTQLIEATKRYFVRAGCDRDGSWVDHTRVQA